jgi:hypothetical protein
MKQDTYIKTLSAVTNFSFGPLTLFLVLYKIRTNCMSIIYTYFYVKLFFSCSEGVRAWYSW